MSDYVTRQEQEEMGMVHRPYGDRFVPAREPGGVRDLTDRDLTDNERAFLAASLGAGATIMGARQHGYHAHSDDSAWGLAMAALAYSLAYAVALLVITAGLMLAAWLTLGGEGGRWLIAWLVVWGIACLGALAINRWQGLHYSPSGLAHHEIESRERVALETMHRHADIIERRLELEQGRSDVKYIEVDDE